VDENQLFLFAAEIASRGEEPPPEPKPAASEPRPAPPGHWRQRLPQSLERRRVVYDLAEGERQCPECQMELLAHVAVSKFGDHLPLHRQEAIFARQGVELSRQTMCDWMRQCAELVSPLAPRGANRSGTCDA
jgi:transposase